MEKMRAVVFDNVGEADVLYIGEVAKPFPNPFQLLVRVYAAGINRADTLQRKGKYPAPKGDSDILGLEIAGEVIAMGDQVRNFIQGERVFGLVGGGGYAEYCLLDSKMAMKMPSNWDYSYAASIPEAFLTANETVFELGKLCSEQNLLLHAAASGVGTTAIQMAKVAGARVFATVGSKEKCERLMSLGVTAVTNYKEVDFLPWVMEKTENQGVDVVEDFVGANNFERNLAALKTGGRLIQVATMSGAITNIDLRILMSKRLTLIGSVMRSRSLSDKQDITSRFVQRWWDSLITGEIVPIIDSVYDWHEVVKAHERMESNANIGKIVLTMNNWSE